MIGKTLERESDRPVYLIKPETDRENFTMALPLGILYLAGALEGSGYRVHLVHERFTPDVERAVLRRILADNPLYVGISTFTGPSLVPALRLSRRIKRESRIPVIWGGLHATMLPEQTLQEESIDAVVCGEGEQIVSRLAEAFSGEAESTDLLSRIPGVAWRSGPSIQANPIPDFIQNLDDFPPAWHLLEIDRYIAETYFYTGLGSKTDGLRVAGVMTSRGCPMRCCYCYNQFVNHRTFRTHSVPFVLKQVRNLREHHGVNAVVFEDDCMFARKERALEIITQIGLPWASSVRADYLARWGEAFIRELKDKKCFELRIGAESGSQSTLDLMQKDIRREDILRSAELCIRHDIHVSMGFLIGIPGESWEEMQKTFDLMDELMDMGVLVIPGPSVYFPYPGTPMFEEAVGRGFRPPDRVRGWSTISWGTSQPLPPYVDRRAQFVAYFRSLAMKKPGSAKLSWIVRPLQSLARWRWRRRCFRIPLDYKIPYLLLVLLRRLGLRKLAGAIEHG